MLANLAISGPTSTDSNDSRNSASSYFAAGDMLRSATPTWLLGDCLSWLWSSRLRQEALNIEVDAQCFLSIRPRLADDPLRLAGKTEWRDDIGKIVIW